MVWYNKQMHAFFNDICHKKVKYIITFQQPVDVMKNQTQPRDTHVYCLYPT